MNFLLTATQLLLQADITITGSKSETNRLLLLQALYPNLCIENGSNSDDAIAMIKGLQVKEDTVDIHHAGTAMRFLTAFFATQKSKDVLLTGSQRMQERPIGVLVAALQELGATIHYTNKKGYPPIHIKGQQLIRYQVSLPADISSQYISALMLVAPSLPNGLEINLLGEITSKPYIKMTLALLHQIGVAATFQENQIKISPKKEVTKQTLIVESDWSSASYWYSMVALAEIGSKIKLNTYKKDSLQGDACLADIYTSLGVSTTFQKNTISIEKVSVPKVTSLQIDLKNAPDIAQTIAVCCFGLGIEAHLTGLHTLKIKETDRLEALKTELGKLGAQIKVSNKELWLAPTTKINKNIAIATYNDHRMAMAFAPLALKVPIQINNAEVVSKSYPDFWEDLKKVGVIEKVI